MFDITATGWGHSPPIISQDTIQCETNKNNLDIKVEVVKPRFHSGTQPKKIESVFTHQVTGAAKDIGVHFHGPLPKGYIPPVEKFKESSSGSYLRLTSKICSSGIPNYRRCRVQVLLHLSISSYGRTNLDYVKINM